MVVAMQHINDAVAEVLANITRLVTIYFKWHFGILLYIFVFLLCVASVIRQNKVAVKRRRMVYGNGKVYEGPLKEGKPHGQGRLLCDDKFEYYGDWKNGERHGKGLQIWTDSSLYDGEWAADRMHGRGELHAAHAAFSYTGCFKNSKFHGDGRYRSSEQIYHGEFRNSGFHGQGTVMYGDGRSYTGQWKHGSWDGHGRYDISIDVFEIGEWKDGNRNGTIRRRMPDGSDQICDYKDDLPVNLPDDQKTSTRTA